MRYDLKEIGNQVRIFFRRIRAQQDGGDGLEAEAPTSDTSSSPAPDDRTQTLGAEVKAQRLQEVHAARRSKDHAKAIDMLNELLAWDPDDLSLFKTLANVRADIGDHVGVVEALNRVLAVEPLGPHTEQLYAQALQPQKDVRLQEVRAARRAKDHAKAIDILTELLAQDPEDLSLFKALANVKADMGDHAGVVEALNRVLAVEPLGPHTGQLHAQALTALQPLKDARLQELQAARRAKDHAKAIDIVNELLAQDPEDLSLFKTLATLRFDMQDNSGVLEALDQVRASEPLGPTTRIMYARALLRLNRPSEAVDFLVPLCEADPPNVGALFHLAQAKARHGDVDGARAVLERLADDAVADPKKWLMLANGYRETGDHAHAMGAFEICADQGFLDASGWVNYGRTALRCGDYARAEAILAETPDKERSPFQRLFSLYEAQLKGDRLAAAEQTAVRLVDLVPTTAAEWSVLGRMHRLLGAFDTAIEAFESAQSLGADAYVTSQEIADCDLRQGMLARAEERAKALVEERPDDPRSHFILARVRSKQGQFDASRHHFERVVELNPMHASAYRELATIFMQEAKFMEAIELLTHALEIDPTAIGINLELAALYLQMGKYKDARTYVTHVLTLDPEKPEALNFLETLKIFDGGSAEDQTLALVVHSRRAAEFADPPKNVQVLAFEGEDFRDVAGLSEADWLVFVPEAFSKADISDLAQRLTRQGALLMKGGAILALRNRFLRQAMTVFESQTLSPGEFLIRLQARAREILPNYDSFDEVQPLVPQTMSGKVLLISSYGHNMFGGGEHFLRSMAQIYADLGFTPILVGHRGEANRSGVTKDGVRFFEFRTDSDTEFREFLLTEQPAFAHLLAGSGTFLQRTAQDINLPTIYGTHFWREMFNGSGWYPDIDLNAVPRKEFLSLAIQNTVVYANSTFTLDMQYDYHKLISQVLYSLPPTETLPAERDGRDIVLLVNARPEKGFDIFLELAARCPEFQFVSIAGQSVRDDAVEAAERLGISNVQIIDQVEDMSPLYNRAWCVLVPSFHFIETFSRVVIEAQRFGVPVIGSDRGNVPHLLTRSGVALPEVPDLWADELRRLGTDTGYWEERSARATENSKRYSFSQQKPIVRGLARQALLPVLIAVGAGIGNIIQCTPAIRKISEFLDQPVDVVINQDFPGCEWLLAGSKYVNMVFSSDSLYVGRRYEYAFVLASFGKVIPQFQARNTYVARQHFPFQLTEHVHEAEYNLKCLAGAGIGLDYEPDDVKKYFVGNRRPTGLTSRRIILHAGGKGDEWAVKRWPYFEELAVELIARGWEVASVGGGSEYVEGTIDLTGTPLRESIATIQNAAYMIANDSGLMHVADGMDVPLTAIFAPTSVVKNGPLSVSSQVIALEKDCAPCQFNARFNTCTCIREISLETVLERVLTHLEAVTGNGG